MKNKIVNSPRTEQLQKEERSALSLILGLRMKFARERDNPQNYNSEEMWQILSRLLNKGNQKKIQEFGREAEVEGRTTQMVDEIIDKEIRKSKIFRMDWDSVYGMSLTKRIHLLRNSGKDVDETYKILRNHPNLKDIINKNKKAEQTLLKNLKVSVHARFVENKTAEKMKGDEKEQ